jgi:hypothetical protein
MGVWWYVPAKVQTKPYILIATNQHASCLGLSRDCVLEWMQLIKNGGIWQDSPSSKPTRYSTPRKPKPFGFWGAQVQDKHGCIRLLESNMPGSATPLWSACEVINDALRVQVLRLLQSLRLWISLVLVWCPPVLLTVTATFCNKGYPKM